MLHCANGDGGASRLPAACSRLEHSLLRRFSNTSFFRETARVLLASASPTRCSALLGQESVAESKLFESAFLSHASARTHLETGTWQSTPWNSFLHLSAQRVEEVLGPSGRHVQSWTKPLWDCFRVRYMRKVLQCCRCWCHLKQRYARLCLTSLLFGRSRRMPGAERAAAAVSAAPGPC